MGRAHAILLAEERRRLPGRWVHGATELLELLAAGGRWEEIIPLARSGILRYPVHDKFHFQLIQALLRSANWTKRCGRTGRTKRSATESSGSYHPDRSNRSSMLPDGDRADSFLARVDRLYYALPSC